MKVLKSGIEVDPSDLSKLRGGACACGCGIGFNGENFSVSGDESSECLCGCTGQDGDYGGYIGMDMDALEALARPG